MSESSLTAVVIDLIAVNSVIDDSSTFVLLVHVRTFLTAKDGDEFRSRNYAQQLENVRNGVTSRAYTPACNLRNFIGRH